MTLTVDDGAAVDDDTVTVTAGVTTVYSYDQANRLVAVDRTAPTAEPVAGYTYSSDGLRLTKTTPDGGTVDYVWDRSGPTPLLIARVDAAGATHIVYGPGRLPVQQTGPTATIWYHNDHLGSTRITTDDTGQPTATYSYHPYGATSATTGTPTALLTYAGEPTDPETGYIYLRNRYHDPHTAQFTTRDPLTALTHDPHSYTSGNPINYTDPSGYSHEFDWVEYGTSCIEGGAYGFIIGSFTFVGAVPGAVLGCAEGLLVNAYQQISHQDAFGPVYDLAKGIVDLF